MPGNKLSVWDAQRLKGRCFLNNIKAVFTTSWSDSKAKHEIPHSGHIPGFHSPNLKNITHIPSLTRSGMFSLFLKRWGPWTMYIDWSSICSLSKEEHGSTSSYFRVDIISVTCETKQAYRGLDLEAAAARWKQSEKNTKLYQTRPPANQEAVLTLNEEWWSFISLTLSRQKREKKQKKENNPQISPHTF